MAKVSIKPWYVTHPNGALIVEAQNESQAVAHVAKSTIKAQKCSAMDVLKHMKDGLTVETANPAPVEREELPLAGTSTNPASNAV